MSTNGVNAFDGLRSDPDMLSKALPLFALIVSLGLMIVGPQRRFLKSVAIELLLLGLVAIPIHIEHARLIPSSSHPDEPWLQALAVVWWMGAARLVVTVAAALHRGSQRSEERLFFDLVTAGIYLAAIVFVLNSVLEMPVQGVLATSGLIAIVLGLALQNTLADVFAGIAVGVERPFHVGDEIFIAEHTEGVVVQMNWRSVRIQQNGDLAIVPNSVIAKAQIVNRSRPTPRRSATVGTGLSMLLLAKRVRTILASREADTCYPFVDKPGILTSA
jgi:small-conductance mechanosensitive channel